MPRREAHRCFTFAGENSVSDEVCAEGVQRGAAGDG